MRDKINDFQRLVLMLEEIDNIYQFLEGSIDCDSFIKDKKLCHAVIYNLQCIGENAYKLSRAFTDAHQDTDWHTIEGLRHVLVHDYYTVNFERVWFIIKKDLPLLESQLKEYLKESS